MQQNSPRAHSSTDSPLGPLRLAASAHGLSGVWFKSQCHSPSDALLQTWVNDPEHPILLAAIKQLRAYFRAERLHFDLPLDVCVGTPFQQSVWHALQHIPAGQTCSYGELADLLGRPKAARAVGLALGRNPLALVLPCHRVLGRQGALCGYAGGLDRKAALLVLEQAALGLRHAPPPCPRP